MYLDAMSWNSMSYKIGRLPDVPLDGLSFANYHKSIREDLLMNASSFSGRTRTIDDEEVHISGLFFDDEGNVRPEIDDLSIDAYIDMLFLNALQRRATATEQTNLQQLFRVNLHFMAAPTGGEMIRPDRHDDIAADTFDYISRLPEFYYFKAVNQGE